MERTDFEQWKPREVSRLLALVETERRYYQEMIAALPAPIAVLTSKHAIASSNRAFRKLAGMRNDELRGKQIDQAISAPGIVEQIIAGAALAEPRPFDLLVNDKPYRCAAIPMRNWEDELETETLLLLEDMPSTDAAPAAVAPPPAIEAPKEVPAAETVSGMPAIVWQAELPNHVFISVTGAKQILGYTSAHWSATPDFYSQRIHQDDRAHVLALYEAAAETNTEASAEFRAISSSGFPVWVRESVKVQDGIMTGILMPIGKRKQLEAQLITAGRIDAIHDLSTRLAHDFNNPLMIVTGYAEELLHSLPEDSPSRADVQQILDATERMSELAADLLDFTRPKAKPASRVNVSQLLASIDEPMRNLAGRNIQINVPQDHSEWTLADKEQLEDCILALAVAGVENTTGNAGLTVTVHTDLIAEHTDPAPIAPGIYTRVDLFASGNAVDPKAGSFEKFLPAKSGSRTGQALARAYAIVREWGGDILYSAQADAGTAFVMLLPYAEPERANVMQMPSAPAPTVAPTPNAVPLQEEMTRANILVVEDEGGIRALVAKILRREHYKITEAESAEEALEIVKQQGQPDLLLTDIMLPGMNGLQLASAMRNENPGLKVVYVSGYAGDEAAYGELPLGSRFLPKPFTLGALTSAVRETLFPE